MLIPPPTLPPASFASPSRRNRRGLALVFCALALLPGPATRGDIQKSSRAAGQGGHAARDSQEAPPAAVAGNARVDLGGRVEIVLQADGGESHEVDFLIRQPPAHGAFAGPPRQLTRNTASVTYVHRAADGPQGDVFTFAVQVMGGRVSASQPVVVRVTDTAPDLAASPTELDFGAVNAGDTSRAEITLENRGGGVAVGELAPPAPWEVDGPPAYRLARGEHRTFPLVFRPVRSESFSETMRLPGREGGHGVRLIGIGLGTIPAPAVATDPVPPPLATPDPGGKVPPAESPRAESAPVLAAPPAAPVADSVRPAIPLPAASARNRGSSAFGVAAMLAVGCGLALVAGAALCVRRWQSRRRSARSAGEIGGSVPGRGMPAKEKINRGW